MRQILQEEQEAPRISLAGTMAAVSSVSLVDDSAELKHASFEQLIEQCSRDTPLLEALNAVCFASNAGLVAAVALLLNAAMGGAAVVTAGSLVGINVGLRRSLATGYTRDAALFGELGPDAVPELVEQLANPITRVELVVSRVLALLLPTLSAPQFRSLSTQTRTELYNWLRKPGSDSADSKAAIVRWLSSVADVDAIGVIEYISRIHTLHPAKRRLRSVARQALPKLMLSIDSQLQAAGNSQTDSVQTEEELAFECSTESRALVNEMRKLSVNRSSPGMRIGFLIANWCAITPYAVFQCFKSVVDHAPGPAVIWLVLTALSTQLYRLALMPAHVQAARQLAGSGDTHAVGPLAEALEWPDEEIQMVARVALISLLPKLTENDATLLGNRQIRCLNARLVLSNSKNYMESELQLRILQAWEKVGDVSSLQAVRALVNAKATLVNEKKIQLAAIKCLPLLEARAHINEASKELLRGSGIENSAVDTLVRPASSKEEAVNELLRPGE